jgi:hypothetical protein
MTEADTCYDLRTKNTEPGAAHQRLSARVVEKCGHSSTGSVTDAAYAASAPSPCPVLLPPAGSREPWVSLALGKNMNSTGINRLFFCLIAFFILFSSPAIAQNDYRLPLPHGCLLARVHSGASVICDSGGRILVGPSSYGILVAVIGNLVVGNLDTEESAYHVPLVPDRYFIVDTKTLATKSELSRADYLKELEIRHITSEPRLIRPNKLTKF